MNVDLFRAIKRLYYQRTYALLLGEVVSVQEAGMSKTRSHSIDLQCRRCANAFWMCL